MQKKLRIGGSPPRIRRKCSFCGEVIRREAVVCRYCRRDLRESARSLTFGFLTGLSASRVPARTASVPVPELPKSMKLASKNGDSEEWLRSVRNYRSLVS